MAHGNEEIAILIAEDDALLRNFLLAKLSGEERFMVVGSVGNGREALEAASRLQPNVLLLDLTLPDISGMKVLETLAACEPAPAVLVLSGSETEETQLEAARHGAKGFLCKSQASVSLVEAIRTVAAGELWLPRRIVSHLLGEYPAVLRRVRDRERPLNQLTEREREVLLRVAQGRTNQQIARELYMSVSTVKAHIRSIFRRFDLPSRTEAAVFAVREGLLEQAEQEAKRNAAGQC
jgi:two-component system, NarL family, response regulator NreC